MHFFSSKTVNEDIDIGTAINRVVRSQRYIGGEEVTSFEKEFADYVGVSQCVSVGNGTDALEIGLRSVGVERGDAVIVVANAGFYSSAALHLIGARPVYVDVNESLNISPEEFSKALSHNPKAVVVTHLYGLLADVHEIVNIARAHGVAVVEDVAEAHGARRDGKLAGSFGDVGCFSFYPTKNLGALGDGGALTFNDNAYAENARYLKQYGWSSKYHVSKPYGRNSRLDDMQAAILREKLPHLDKWNEQRRKIASLYNEAFKEFPVTLPPSLGEDYVGHLYVLRVENRNEFRAYLEERGIPTDVHFPVPDHMQEAYTDPITVGDLVVTEQASKKIVSLPCYPGLPDDEINKVIEAVSSYFLQAKLETQAC